MKKSSFTNFFKTVPEEIGAAVIIIFVILGLVYVTNLRSNISSNNNWKNFETKVENGKIFWKEAENFLKDNSYQKAEEKYYKADLKFENVAKKASKRYNYLKDHDLLKDYSSIEDLKNYLNGSENASQASKTMIKTCIALQEKKHEKAENLRKKALTLYKMAENHFENIECFQEKKQKSQIMIKK